MIKWREEIKKDANKFYSFCVHYDLIPNIFNLHEFWNWSTPVTLGHKLFDTILYVTFLPKKLNSSIDNSEVSKIEVCYLIFKIFFFFSFAFAKTGCKISNKMLCNKQLGFFLFAIEFLNKH